MHIPPQTSTHTEGNRIATASVVILFSVAVVSLLFAGPAAAAITETETDGPAQAMAGDTITVSLDVAADSADISAVQISPEEQADHVNEFAATELVDAGAETQIEEPGFVVYNELQEDATVEWDVTVPDDAEVGDTITLSGDALTGNNERTSFIYTVEITDAAITEATMTGDEEAVAGDTVDLSLETTADAAIISAVQINPDEQADHVNGFNDTTVVDAGAETQVEEPGFIAYAEAQEDVTVEWEATVPEDAAVDDTITITGDVLDDNQNRQSFTHTVTVIDDPADKYRNDNGDVDDRGLIDALSDWRNDDIKDVTLIDILSEWRE